MNKMETPIHNRQQSVKRKVSYATSFVLADGKPLEFKDYAKAVTKSTSVFKDIPKDEDGILEEFAAKRRKIAVERKNSKLEKEHKRGNAVKHDSLNSNGNSELTNSSIQDDDEDDIEWSDCEAEISRNISILEQSTSTPTIDRKKHSTPVNTSSTSNGLVVSTNSTNVTNSTNPTTLDDDNRPTSSHNTDQDEIDWDDSDEADFLRGVGSFERSFNSSSVSKLDRSALQEISNLSRQDQ